jgi:hypothetical protein
VRLPIATIFILLAACGSSAGHVREPTGGVQEDPPPDPVPAPLPDPVAPQHGRATVEQIVEDLVRGFQHGNRQELLSLFPPQEVMAEALVCPHGNMLIEEVAHAQEELWEALDELEGVTLELVGIVPRQGKILEYEAGAYVEDGCSAGADLTLREVVLTVLVTEGGHAQEKETDEILVMQVGGGGPWYLLGPD